MNSTWGQENYVADQVQDLIDDAWDYALATNDSALILSEKALSISKENEYPMGEVLALESMGLYHEMVTGDIDLASSFYFQAIEMCETHDLDYVASVYHSLGVMFHTTDNYELAQRYYNESLEKASEIRDSVLIKKCLINLGSVFSSLDDYGNAESFMKKSLEIDVQNEMNYATYANLGYLYVKQEKFDLAIPMLMEATKEAPDNPDPDLNLYFLLHAKSKAKDSTNMTQALVRAKRAAKSDQYGLRDHSLLLRNIADYLAFTGRYKQALSFRDQYIEVYEKIKEKQRDEITLELETQYETERKDAELALMKVNSEKQEQQMQMYAIVALSGLIIAGLIGFFLYKNRKKNALLTKQKIKLEENVEEINLLLREVHHRVKNNLQVITSLLNIQQRSISDQRALNAIQESKNRIESMGLIHKSFYQNKNLGKINTREYIQNLVDEIFQSYNIDKENIKLRTELGDIFLDMDTLVPMGLIINELVSNTLKHAFTHQKEGELSISLNRVGNEIKLEVSDNGQGIDNVQNLENSASFGFNMIKAFVKKLHGRMDINSSHGTTFIIEFEDSIS